MSVLKPVQKKQKTSEETLNPAMKVSPLDSAEERSHPTSSAQAEEKTTEKATHPKGHHVKDLSEVWKTMDQQSYLRVSDTLALNDVLVQPIGVHPENKSISSVDMIQMVEAPHIKFRRTTCKMSNDDLLRMLYLNDHLQWSMRGCACLSFEEWLNEKSAECIKMKGVEEGTDRGKLCNFIICDDKSFSFYPIYLHLKFGVFFRKMCYHSYKDDDKSERKMANPAMMKCNAMKSKFEYVLQARIVEIPEDWFDVANPTVNSTVDRTPTSGP